jgi:hypothetical protein
MHKFLEFLGSSSPWMFLIGIIAGVVANLITSLIASSKTSSHLVDTLLELREFLANRDLTPPKDEDTREALK